MEHRQGSRICGQLGVELWQGNSLCGKAMTENVSQGGLYIANTEKKPSIGDLYTIKFNPTATPQQQQLERRAMVIHITERGMGLMWADPVKHFLADLDGLKDIWAYRRMI